MNLFKPTYHINPRYAIEITIRKFNPNISDEELIEMRKDIYLEAIHKTDPSVPFIRNYNLYTK